MADERFPVVQGEVIQPFFTHEDAALVEMMAARCANTLVVLGGTPEELGMASGEIDHLTSLADRIQQWLDQQGTRLEPGTMSYQWLDQNGSPIGERVVVKALAVLDDTDLTEEG